jgi:hypothetical protein
MDYLRTFSEDGGLKLADRSPILVYWPGGATHLGDRRLDDRA